MPRVRGRRTGRPDSSGPRRHHVRVQARSGRQVQQDHESRRRPVSRHGSRVGADRSHSRQIDRRHPDSQPEPRSHLAARTARFDGVSTLRVEAHPRARKDDPWRAVRHRPGHHAPSADRRLDGHRQVGRAELDADEHSLSRHARRGAAHHDRPEAAGTGNVRRDPAAAHPRRRRSQESGQRTALGRAGNGRTVQDARRRGRAQHRAVQPQRQARAAGDAAARTPKPPSRCRSSSS